MARVRINRMERRTPYLSNTVTGNVVQETPNGIARNVEPAEPSGVTGSQAGTPQVSPPFTWPGGNRSGE